MFLHNFARQQCDRSKIQLRSAIHDVEVIAELLGEIY